MKNFFRCTILTGLFLTLVTCVLHAQNTNVQLPTEVDSSSSFRILNSTGITRLQVNSDGGFYVGGVYPTGVIPKEGMGIRLMWYPRKAAFRVGEVSGTQWDDANIGEFSMAMGYNTNASGQYSTAMGQNTTASGNYSTAMGYHTTASGSYSTVMGYSTTASGIRSIAIGHQTIASGNYSTAMGCFVKAKDEGSFYIGDHSVTSYDSSYADNQMIMRFAGGYRLYSNSACTTGVVLLPGGGSWASISDSTKKTNCENADGEYFLRSISQLRLGSWNYKGQDEKNFRHYGPMAQEIFHYFGKDKYGTIGNETTLASADMDGIMMICLQALEKRTAELKTEKENTVQLQASFDELKKEIAKMKSDIQSLTESKTDQVHESVTLNTINKGQ
jgi:hypothetical protein